MGNREGERGTVDRFGTLFYRMIRPVRTLSGWNPPLGEGNACHQCRNSFGLFRLARASEITTVSFAPGATEGQLGPAQTNRKIVAKLPVGARM